MRQLLPFHEKHPALHEVAIVAAILLFLGFGFGWSYTLAAAVLLGLLYLVSAIIVWTKMLRARRSRKTENGLIAPRSGGNGL